ncbi:MAG: bifunctional deaminase-reductase domain protein [Frankiales bacterium]|nr:bifunctional deaminase-reductase domain protein [Frankiales bacterium]
MRQLHPVQQEVPDLCDLYDVPGPHLRAGFVASVDGVIAVNGRSSGLSSPADKVVFRALRTVCDAVLVGAGTARQEDYGPVRHDASALAWRAAHGRRAETPVVVVSRSGSLPDRLLTGPVIACVPGDVVVPAGVDVLRTTDPVGIVSGLHERGFTRLLCEGGPSLLTSFLQAEVVDELCLTTSPLLAGAGPHLIGDLEVRQLELRSLVYDDPGVLLGRWAVVRSTDE